MAFKIGDVVRLKSVVPQGPIVRMRMDEETGMVSYLLEWTDHDGQTQQRWFSESQLEA
jgi:uncharacterized protein YodC (DUF2158 family)